MIHACPASQLLECQRTIVLVMIAFEQHNLLRMLAFQLDNLHQVPHDVSTHIAFNRVRVEIIAQKNNPVSVVKIPTDRLFPKQPAVHIGDN